MELVKYHYGHPVVYEKELIELVKIPVNGEELHHCVLLHPRYKPPKKKYDTIKVRGYRRGRSLDILLEEPLKFAGQEYGVLNFKGVGADADAEMVIHPNGWYKLCWRANEYFGGQYERLGEWYKRWAPAWQCDDYGRVWGALLKEDGIAEFADNLLPDLGIQFVPHMALNHVPRNVCKHIAEKRRLKRYKLLTQLVRALKTNIRCDEPCYSKRFDCADPARLAGIDSAVISAERKLKRHENMLVMIGTVNANRLIDGTFIDAENYRIEKYNENIYISFIYGIIMSSLKLIRSDYQDRNYRRILKEKTGVQIRIENSFRDIEFKEIEIRNLSKRY